MSTILFLEAFDLDYDAVMFYSVRFEEKEESETDTFIARFKIKDHEKYEIGFEEEIDDILFWIDAIGNRGMRICHLREENAADALPPKKSFLRKAEETFVISNSSFSPIPMNTNNLRLYCVKLNQTTLVLCGGGKKESQQVKDSPDALPHFRLANKIAKQLEKMILDKEIQFDIDTGKIIDIEHKIEIWLD